MCGWCLWYAESGERLCPDHAAEFLRQGRAVTPPERYAEGIGPSEVSAARTPGANQPYQGNSTDVTGLLAAFSGVVAWLSCFGLTWLFPLMAFAMGLAAFLQARDSADPARTRLLGGLGVATGGVFVLFFFVFLAGFMACFLTIFFSSAMQPTGGFPTQPPFLNPTPVATPTP